MGIEQYLKNHYPNVKNSTDYFTFSGKIEDATGKIRRTTITHNDIQDIINYIQSIVSLKNIVLKIENFDVEFRAGIKSQLTFASFEFKLCTLNFFSPSYFDFEITEFPFVNCDVHGLSNLKIRNMGLLVDKTEDVVVDSFTPVYRSPKTYRQPVYKQPETPTLTTTDSNGELTINYKLGHIVSQHTKYSTNYGPRVIATSMQHVENTEFVGVHHPTEDKTIQIQCKQCQKKVDLHVFSRKRVWRHNKVLNNKTFIALAFPIINVLITLFVFDPSYSPFIQQMGELIGFTIFLWIGVVIAMPFFMAWNYTKGPWMGRNYGIGVLNPDNVHYPHGDKIYKSMKELQIACSNCEHVSHAYYMKCTYCQKIR